MNRYIPKVMAGGYSMAILFWGSVIASMILYGNTLAAIRNIRDKKDTKTNLTIGCLCIGFIVLSILEISGR